MIDFIQNTLDGVMVGSSYALLALGFTLIFGTMRRLNLAYGPTIMAGAYLGTYAFARLGRRRAAGGSDRHRRALRWPGSTWSGCASARSAQGAAIASMISSFAVWMQIEEAATLAAAAAPQRVSARLMQGAPISVGPFPFRPEHLLMLVVAAGSPLCSTGRLHHTRFGLGVRTVIDHRRAAELVGVPVTRTMMLAFVLASAIGGVAGFLIAASEAPDHAYVRHVGDHQGADRHDAGRTGLGARRLLGGLALGVIEAHAQGLFGPQVRDLVAWGAAVRGAGAVAGRADGRAPLGRGGSRAAAGVSAMDDYPRRRPLQYRHRLVRGAVGLRAAAGGRGLFRPAGVLRHRCLCRRHGHRHAASGRWSRRCCLGRARRRDCRPPRSGAPPCASPASTSPWRRWRSPRWCASSSSCSPGRSTIGGTLVGPKGTDGFGDIRYLFENEITPAPVHGGHLPAAGDRCWPRSSCWSARASVARCARPGRDPLLAELQGICVVRVRLRRGSCGGRACGTRRRALRASAHLRGARQLQHHAGRAQPGLRPDRRPRHGAGAGAGRADRHRRAGILAPVRRLPHDRVRRAGRACC